MAVLDGRVALVTGASSGIGEAVAIALAEAGAKVAVNGRRAERLAALVAKIEAAGGAAFMLPGDMTDEHQASRIVADTAAHFGRLDILVNSAGVVRMGSIEESDPAEWRAVIDVNLMASYYPCRAAIPIMKVQGQGDIVNISSTAGRRASAFVSSYTASKHALNAMTEALRREVGALGIRVCVIEPGATVSEVYDSLPDPAQRDFMREHVTKAGAMAAEDVAAAILFAVGLPRRANVTEILIQPTSDVVAR